MRRVGDKKQTVAPKPAAPKQVQPVQPKVDVAAKAQMEATLAMTEIAAQAINNPQLTQILSMLSQPKQEVPQSNKRLLINRDANGLIKSIDIQNI